MAGAGGLFVLRRFSNWARREDTGFCAWSQQLFLAGEKLLTMDEPSMFSSCWLSMMFVLSSAGTGRYPIAAHRPVRSSSHLALLVRVEGEAVARGRSCSQRYGCKLQK